MSGICIAAGVPDASARVARMLARMCTYGQKHGIVEPGRELAGGRAFHGRLAAERAPTVGPGGVTVLLDGEIFDEDGPIGEPEARIADLYRSGQSDRIAWLNGSFSSIIVDHDKRRIVLASDRLASRPLFVWSDHTGLAAASRLDALLADDRVPRRLSVQGLMELVAMQRTVADHTQYADVRAMQAAELWTFSNGEMSRRHTRRLSWRRPDFDEREGAVRLAEALRRAVARRTADRVRHGLLLSGGLDARVVLAAARRLGRTPSCLTAGPFRNTEVAVAQATARRAGVPFRYFENPPSTLMDQIDPATVASDGLYAAPINLFGLLPEMACNHDVLLSGHGLDYTIRGYYLPCRMIRIAGSVTRLPWLRAIPDGTPATLVRNLRVGIKHEAVLTVLQPRLRGEMEARKVAAVAAAIAPADIDNPYNAWDAYVLACLGRHYAYSDFVAMESVIAHRAVSFDPEVFDLYLSMPPQWRASGRIARAAMAALGPDLMALPDANSGFPARYPFPAEAALVFARAGLRRAGVLSRPVVPDPTMSHGSWPNFPELLRRDPGFVARLSSLRECAAMLDTGLFSREGLAAVVDQHLERRADHAKLLLQLLTVASWLERNAYAEVVYDG